MKVVFLHKNSLFIFDYSNWLFETSDFPILTAQN